MSNWYMLNEDFTVRKAFSISEYVDDKFTTENVILKQTRINEKKVNEKRLTTVFLGLDHNHHNSGKPVLFETILFTGNSSEDIREKYSTYEEALEGHERLYEQYILIPDEINNDPLNGFKVEYEDKNKEEKYIPF